MLQPEFCWDLTADFMFLQFYVANSRLCVKTRDPQIYNNLWPMKAFWGSFSALFPQTCPINLGGCINDSVLTKLNKQRTLSGEYWDQDTSDLIWVKVNEQWRLPWLWSKPETDATWISQNDLTKIHFQLDLETVLNVLYIFVQVLPGSQWYYKLHFNTFFMIVRGRTRKKLLFWKMTDQLMEPHCPRVVRSTE